MIQLLILLLCNVIQCTCNS